MIVPLTTLKYPTQRSDEFDPMSELYSNLLTNYALGHNQITVVGDEVTGGIFILLLLLMSGVTEGVIRYVEPK